ncbi:GPH family glycoside/pentoside/hexuronide:cation symporter [Streptomyces sp. Amel2xB2]|uniref:MFS transporter n=1 Tax=Streptomyces sp. Amel2xB2 TaxID=1305829 RepID=UPI000DBF6EE4|nr:MFS transporter [Streptomyces sp. Amel2xB2]RAJ63369.1 GPH family glycoside/pentoside/hexuronide:cation symporter [Streptomyces sp. Amel2xB2]
MSSGVGQDGTVAAGPLPASVRTGYGLGSLCTGTFATVPGLLLLYYLTNVMAVPAATAGVALFIPKVWDVLINPVVGVVCDRSRLRGGPRRPFLLIGACTLPPLFALIFAAPPLRGTAAAAYVAALFMLAATAYAVFQVPYVVMPAEMTHDTGERGRLLAWRVGFLGAAILVSGAVAPAIAHADGDTPSGYRTMGVAVALLLACGMFASWWGTGKAPAVAHTTAEPSLRAQLTAARGNRPFLYLAGMWTAQALAVGVMLAGVQYFATYVLGSADAVTPLFICLIGPLALVMPVWNRLARARGVKYAQFWASWLFFAATVVLALTPWGGAWPAYATVALVGVAYGGLQLLPLRMLADTLVADAARTGRQRAATFTGLWTASETLAFALGAGAFAAVLAVTGFRSSDAVHAVDQPASAVTGIALGMSLVPAAFALVSIWLLHRYREDPVPDAPASAPASASASASAPASASPAPVPAEVPAEDRAEPPEDERDRDR